MRKVIFSLFFLIGIALPISTASAYQVIGQECDSSTQNTSICENRNTTENPVAGANGILGSAINILSWVIGVVAVIMVIFSGFKYITSAGDSNAINSAKNTLLYAIIGLVVAVFAQAIVIFVINKV